MNLELIRKRITALRKAKRLTQVEISEQLGIGRSTYTHYEISENQRIPELETLLKLADFHKVSLNYILGRNEVTIVELTHPDIQERFSLEIDDNELTKDELGLFTSLIRVQRMQKKSP